MSYKSFLFILVFFVFPSCCERDPGIKDIGYPNYANLGIAFVTKDSSTTAESYRRIQIDSVKWLGTQFMTTVFDSTAYVSMDIKSNNCSFLVYHEKGIDTVRFEYNWLSTYNEYCEVNRHYEITKAITSSNAELRKLAYNIYQFRLK